MKRYLITTHDLECTCALCGMPLYVGDTAIDDTDNTGECFCSETCARKFWHMMHDETEPKQIAGGQSMLCAAYNKHLQAEITLSRHSKA